MDSHRFDLRSLATALGGDITGQQVLCPGPGHSRRDRSLAVRPISTGFVVYSFANDPWPECRDYVHQRLGTAWQPRHEIQTTWDTDRTERPKAIWAEARDPGGTPAERYLAARTLDLPAELCGGTLRYHPQCPWQDRTAACLIVAFKSFKCDDITAIHRIRVDQPERWPKVERRMLGAIAGSAIKLDVPGQRLCIAEGLETALAARALGFHPVWALGSAKAFPPIGDTQELIILGERDDASRKAAEACARLWTEQGRKVALALPLYGTKDFNDHLMRVC